MRFLPQYRYSHEVRGLRGGILEQMSIGIVMQPPQRGVDYADRVRLALHERSNSVLLHGEMTFVHEHGGKLRGARSMGPCECDLCRP